MARTGRPKGIRKPLIERFDEKVDRTGDCWMWTAATNRDGYGVLMVYNELDEKKMMLAHRVAWVLAHGEVPEGQLVLHSCDTPACVRIDHLRLGTVADNTADMLKRGRARGGDRGRKFSPVLTDEDVRQIRDKYTQGCCSQYQLAAEYGVRREYIGAIVRRERRVKA